MAKVTSIGGGEIQEDDLWAKFTRHKEVEPLMVIAYSEEYQGHVLLASNEYPLEVVGLLDKIKQQYLNELLFEEAVEAEMEDD